eukprot:15483959-Alexandrium_andersonii.AAC.1
MEKVEGYTPARRAFGRQREWNSNLHGNDLDHLLSNHSRSLSNLDLRVKAQNLTNEKFVKKQHDPGINKDRWYGTGSVQGVQTHTLMENVPKQPRAASLRQTAAFGVEHSSPRTFHDGGRNLPVG